MGYVPYIGFATYRRATVKIRLYFKRLMFMQMFCIKKKKRSSQFWCQVALFAKYLTSKFGHDKYVFRAYKDSI